MLIEEVRQKLLEEAKSSPNLLSDLAGLENYIAESYHNRSFIELLQNADDAKSTKFKIKKEDDFLFVANNGRLFDSKDLESLCRSASSTKTRGEAIGYRGIGFKSVVGFANQIHVISGDLKVTFSKEKTRLEIPQASRVPLIRIPHQLDEQDRTRFEPVIQELRSQGFSTIFVFTGVTANGIEAEFDSFDHNSMIFLRNILETEIHTKETTRTTIVKKKMAHNEEQVTLHRHGATSEWLIFKGSSSSVAFSIEDNGIQKLEEAKSLVYAFLPTEDSCGLGVLINSDFSTDPSRRHIIFDDGTLDSVKSCSNQVLNILESKLNSNDTNSLNVINALIPHADPRLLQFKKASFDKYLLEELKNSGSTIFMRQRLCPSWLNVKDYLALTKHTDSSINSQCYGLGGFISFAKYLGAKEDTFENLLDGINSTEVSVLGCVQITNFVVKTIVSGKNHLESSITSLNILLSGNQRISIDDINKTGNLIDDSFISLMKENGLTEFDIKHFFKRFVSEEYISHLFSKTSVTIRNSTTFENENYTAVVEASQPEHVVQWFEKTKEVSMTPAKTNFKRWRSAEEQSLEVFNLNGFRLYDVSKQNIGYDLEGVDPNGNAIQIEIKSITLPGQKFKLTNNEIAVAQEKQETYHVAIVRQTDAFLEIALIPNPVKRECNLNCVISIFQFTGPFAVLAASLQQKGQTFEVRFTSSPGASSHRTRWPAAGPSGSSCLAA